MPTPEDNLPPVQPPSAGFLMQLFVIPMVIVVVIVMVSLMFNWLAHMGTRPEQLVQELGRDPTTEEIADELKVAPRKVEHIMRVSQRPLSLEMPVGEEEDSYLGDFIEDRCDGLAGTAPFRPEIEQNRHVGLENVLGERGIRSMDDVAAHAG